MKKMTKQLNEYKKLMQVDMVIATTVLIIQAFLLMLGMQIITFADYNILFAWFDSDNLYYVMYNFLLFFALLQLAFCLFKKVTLSYILVGSFTIVISVINNMKWVNLKECVTLSDFDKIAEAIKVAEKAEFQMFPGLWLCGVLGFILIFIFVFLDWRVLKRNRIDKEKMLTCRVTFLILVIILIPIIAIDAKNSAVAKLTESRTAEQTGPIVYFVESIFTVNLNETYTIEEAQTSYYEYVKQGKMLAEEQNQAMVSKNTVTQPNIIVVMSEAFFDVNRFEGVLSYSENPMAYFEEIQKESISGNTMVNIYGGSTHFSEFEFLTGWNSKGMNSGSCPYKEYYNKEQPSLARYLKEQGYYTMAIHPYDSYFWNRKNAYPNMGFDTFVDRSRMKYTDMCGYISDDALTNEIIYRYEQRMNQENEPFFCFGVSIANHVAMINGEEFENTANHIEVTYDENIGYSENRQKRVKEYIGGISKTGEALKKLTDYFEKQNEPTVIVFFGDHAPNYAIDILKVGKKEDLAYSTPYLIWSNYDLGVERDQTDINVSYLSTYLIQILNMPLTEQHYYNIALQSMYPIETRYTIENSEGRLYEDFTAEERDAYFDYALDIKKMLPTILKNSDVMKNIWSIK